MKTEFWFENQDRGSVRDFILTALAKCQDVYSGQDGFCAADDPSEIEGDWKLLSAQEAMESIPSDSRGNGWRINKYPSGIGGSGECLKGHYFIFGGNDSNWLWYVPATEEWLTDTDGNTSDPSRYMRVGSAADFIEEQARHMVAL